MAVTGHITLQQLFRHPFVLKVISRVKASTNPIQTYYRLGLDDSASESVPAGIRTFSYDIFDHTRQLASIRPPKIGPKRGRAQKTGTKTGHLLRSHDSLPIAWEDVINTRPHGSPIGTLDRTGQNKVTMQIKHYTEKYRNLREWMASRMFRGGFSIKYAGDDHYPMDLGQGDQDVTFDHPDTHKLQLALGAGATNLIDVPWDDPSADIQGQFFAINRAAERITGYYAEVCWINSATLTHLMNNTDLQAKAGVSRRAWDSVEYQNMKTTDGSTRKGGYDVVFHAMPWITFKVTDAVLQKGGAQSDSRTVTDTELLIPDGKALITPLPGDWLGFAEGSEPVTKNPASAMEIMKGFSTWRRPMTEPSGLELCFLDNFFPVPYNPEAWFYATVTGF